ncbi:unnamed protein product [Urochloa humidicola]
MDCISGLPDELLHDILLRLESTRAAARTSVLSRRWRRVWAHLPELVFDGDGTDADSDDEDSAAPPPAASFPDSIDSALRGYSSSTIVESLDISLPSDSGCPAIPARRVGSWLSFALRHQVRRLHLDVPLLDTPGTCQKAAGALLLPTIDRAQYISLSLGCRWQLQIRLAGAFTALTHLTLNDATMEGRELESLVCSQCPRLSDLWLRVTLAADESDISLRSDSLQTLSFCVDNTSRIEIVAPRMEKLSVYQFDASEARISAPKLAELVWDPDDDFDSDIQFNDTSLHLRVLQVSDISGSLIKKFHKVDELRLGIDISEEIVAYERFVNNDANYLPNCGTLSVHIYENYHGFAPSMLHLLRKCNSVRNFTVDIRNVGSSMKGPSCPLPCPCRLLESCKADDITLDSLEVVEIDLHKGSHEVVEFVKQLSQCNATILKKVVINYFNNKSVRKNEMFCTEVRCACRPNVRVEFIDGRRVCF